MFTVLWLPGSVPVDLLAHKGIYVGCCRARHLQVVLVTILVVPGQLRGMEKASFAPVQCWQVSCRAGQPSLTLFFPSFCCICLPRCSSFSVWKVP